MPARRAVLLTTSESAHPPQLLSCQHIAPVTSLESTLVEVFILKSLKFFRINTYEKHRREGPIAILRSPLATRHSPLSPFLAALADFAPVSPVFATHTTTSGVYPPGSAIIPPRIPGEAQ